MSTYYCNADIEDGDRSVRIEGAGIGVDELRRLSSWLLSTAAWIERQQAKEDGGYRWVFTRGIEPTACYMAGRRAATQVVTLVPVKVRTRRRRGRVEPWECASCETEIPAGGSAWRQKPGSWSGHSHVRFCAACVERGGPPPKPTLSIVRGGADVSTAPRGDLALAEARPHYTEES